MLKQIQEGQPFTVFIDDTNSPARLERIFRRIRRMLPADGRIYGIMQQTCRRKVLDEKMLRISKRYCDCVYVAPGGRENRETVIESVFRHADSCDCVLVLGRQESPAAVEAARQVAYEIGFL